jgi:hypothetical protein
MLAHFFGLGPVKISLSMVAGPVASKTKSVGGENWSKILKHFLLSRKNEKYSEKKNDKQIRKMKVR